MQRQTDHIERLLGDWMRARLPHRLTEFVMFGLKMGWACLFGGVMLAAIILSRALWQADWTFARYDVLFGIAIATQAAFLALRLETWAEARVILLFHLTGTVMELFKVDAGSWSYPEAGVFKVMGVPLFSGFMYASVGSFIARAMRIFRMEFSPYPPFWLTLIFAGAIYVNFFSHHFLPDLRIGLFVASAAIFGRTWVGFTVGGRYRMPMVLAAVLSSAFLWVAENVGTLTGTWVYAGSGQAAFASLAKMGSWYLLLYVAFVTVTLVIREPLRSDRATTER